MTFGEQVVSPPPTRISNSERPPGEGLIKKFWDGETGLHGEDYKRLWALRKLKNTGVSSEDILKFYNMKIRPVLESFPLNAQN